jgi:hypothetical protein
MTKWLIFPDPAPADAVAITQANDAVGFYTGIPPKWLALSEEQGWTLPCSVEEDEEGSVVSWAPVP